MKALRVLATILAGPFLVMGIIWVLQGVNILLGSFMTGDIKWALIGAPLALVGAALVWWVNRPNTRAVIGVLIGMVVLFVALAAMANLMANGGADYRVK